MGEGPGGTPASGESLAGQRVGEYELLGRLATGGMAELFIAKRVGLEGFQKVVVLKRILPHLANNADFVEMFLSEARLAATLEHPNIVHVSDIGRDRGEYFFVMSYLHGKDLLALMRETARLERKLPLPVALAIAVQVCAGLHYAHEQVGYEGQPLGIVHRDVSPANIIVTFNGGVKIVDFGIAKAAAQTAVTRVGVRKGKASYMAPEQCRAEPLDRRVDVWAMGVVLYEMTTMTRLFRADNDLAIMHKIVSGRVPKPSDVIKDYPPELERILGKCLSPDRELRYTTVLDLRRDLEAYARANGMHLSTVEIGEHLLDLFGPQTFPWAAEETTQPSDTAHRDMPSTRATDGITGGLGAAPLTLPAERAGTPPIASGAMTPPPYDRGPGADSHGTANVTKARTGSSPAVSAVTGAFPGPITSAGTSMIAPPGASPPAWLWGAVAVVGVAAVAFWLGRVNFTPNGGDPPVIAETPAEATPPSPGPTPPLNAANMLVLVNQPDPALALDYKRRHRLLDKLAGEPEAGPRIDKRLQVSLDLLQAGQSPTPCTSFAEALRTIIIAKDPYFERALRSASVPDPATTPTAGQPPDGSCGGLDKKLARLRPAPPSPQPTAGPDEDPSERTEDPRASTPAPTEPDAPDKKPNVAEKLD